MWYVHKLIDSPTEKCGGSVVPQCGGSVVEILTPDRRVVGMGLIVVCIVALSKTLYALL